MITVNGERLDIASGLSLDEFLETSGYDKRVIVIGLNGAITPRDSYASAELKDGDELEILNFVNGG